MKFLCTLYRAAVLYGDLWYLLFNWGLLCYLNFFPYFYPELKGVMEPHMFEYNKKPICYILWSIFQFVLWLRESICCFKSLWSLKLLKILPLWTRNKDFSKIEGFVKRDNYSKWNGAALIGIHRLFIFITKSVLCRRKEEKTLQFIINRNITSSL